MQKSIKKNFREGLQGGVLTPPLSRYRVKVIFLEDQFKLFQTH